MATVLTKGPEELCRGAERRARDGHRASCAHLMVRPETYARMSPRGGRSSAVPAPSMPTYQVEDDDLLIDYSDVSSLNSEGEADVWATLGAASVWEDVGSLPRQGTKPGPRQICFAFLNY
eukprot:9257885-Pyramimonas_sp.AAC.1